MDSNSKKIGIGMTSARTRQRLIDRLIKQGIINKRVLDVIEKVPRHSFVDEALSSRAYEDTALPIGFGQTISQPYIVALMTELLVSLLPESGKFNRLLEIGTGCGYQAAILSSFANEVFSIERIKPLFHKSRQNLLKAGIKNVSLRLADGNLGWNNKSPFQGIIVAAAPLKIPKDLLMQLDDGGRIIAPIGDEKDQVLVCISRKGNNFDSESICPVKFVPLIQEI